MADSKLSLDQLFDQALEIRSPTERKRFLDRNCQDDDVRVEVDFLLQSHREAGGFLEPGPSANLRHGLNAFDSGDAAGLSPDSVDENADRSAESSVSCAMDDTFFSVQPRDSLEQSAGPISTPVSTDKGASVASRRYRLEGEIARGGMGAIFKGEDVDIGRELAVKVLLESHRDNPEIVRRFIEEAQIGGQLQHPGIAPLYELGRLPDGRLFFAMKIVRGKTLASLIAERKDTEDRLAELLGVFEQVCQTMGYVHSRGVIHRDLKPANIMVGAFGEVQVMDWGLAKVMRTSERTSVMRSDEDFDELCVSVRTLRNPEDASGEAVGSNLFRSSGSDAKSDRDCVGAQTRVGSVMGTPAYMAPEQARGKTSSLDERADVFGLGAILCEILTGTPPYVGANTQEIYRHAYQGTLSSAHQRLETVPIDSELRELALRAIRKDPAQRFQNAGELADALNSYNRAVIERLRRAELDRAQAQARGDEMQRRRKLNHLIGVMLLVGLVATTLTASYFRTLEAKQRKLTHEKSVLAEHNSDLAKEAKQEQAKTKQAEELALSRLRVARMNLYASQLAFVSQSRRDPEAIARLRNVIASWVPKPGENDWREWEWYYLYSQTKPETLRLRGSTAFNLIELAWSPDESELLTFGQNGRPVCRWGTVTGQIIGRPTKIEPLNGHVARVVFSPDRKTVALMGTTRNNQSAHFGIRDAATMELKSGFQGFHLPGPIDFNHDGSRIAFNSGIHLITADVGSGKIMQKLAMSNVDQSPVFTPGASWQLHRDLKWTADGIRFSLIKGNRVRIYDFTSPEPVCEIDCEAPPRQIKVSASGKFIAIHLDRNGDNVELWEIDQAPKRLQSVSVSADGSGYFGFAWAPADEYIAVTNGIEATVFRTADGSTVSTHHFDERTMHIKWNAAGTKLASAGMYGHSDIWDPFQVYEDTRLGSFDGYAWSRNGRQLCAWKLNCVSVWDSRDWRKVQMLDVDAPIRDVSLDHENHRAAIATSDGYVSLWDTREGRQVMDPPIKIDAQTIDIHPSKDLVVTGWTNTVRVFDLKSGKQIAKKAVYAEWANWAFNSRWFPSGDAVVISSNHGGAAGWLDFTGNDLTFDNRQGNVAMSADGNFWLNVPITRRGIRVQRYEGNRELRLTQQIDVGAGWVLDVNNLGSRVLMPKNDGLYMLHCETGTPLIKWPGKAESGKWDAINLRVAALINGELRLFDPIRGHAANASGRLLPWLQFLVTDNFELDADAIRRRCSVPDLIKTAAVHGEWSMALRLWDLFALSSSELKRLQNSLAVSIPDSNRRSSGILSDATLDEREFWQRMRASAAEWNRFGRATLESSAR